MNMTLKGCLTRAYWRVLIATLVCGVLLVMANQARADERIVPDKPENSFSALLDEHDCWTDNAPEGVIPGHVVTNNGYRGAAEVGRALEQLFEGTDHGLTVYGFCP